MLFKDLHFIGALRCLSSIVLLTASSEDILFVLWLDGIFHRPASGVIRLRLPPIQEDRWVRRSRHTELWAGRARRFCLQQRDRLWKNCKRVHELTYQGMVQLGPSDVHSSLSSLVRCSWSSEMAPVVIAGLTTDAPNAGPPVVFTVCVRERHRSQYHREQEGETLVMK